jgi:hypothetical protein
VVEDVEVEAPTTLTWASAGVRGVRVTIHAATKTSGISNLISRLTRCRKDTAGACTEMQQSVISNTSGIPYTLSTMLENKK